MSVADCVWAIEVSSRRLPWRTACIEKGLATQRLLRTAGVNAILHYGARHQGSRLEAHVWVTVKDMSVIGGPEDIAFAKMAEFP